MRYGCTFGERGGKVNQVSILDCTLRDGGYVNDFKFGHQQMTDIVSLLAKANIEIIECGFLREGASDKDRSLFDSVESIKDVIEYKDPNCFYVAMIQYGAIPVSQISDNDHSVIDGIRLTFHEDEIDDAFECAKALIEKGYEVFVQPVGTTTYSDENLLRLIGMINTIKPQAFYIVDTLGTMYKRDLRRLYYIVDHNLDKSIAIGFHSHNNLQMSFANAQELIQLSGARKIIIDASVLGMGRGAGNLNTELITQFLNINYDCNYSQIELMKIIDGYIRPLQSSYKWGYDAAYYIAAVVGCHPNYASYLLNLQTLNMQSINLILKGLSPEKCSLYDKQYIQQVYREFMECNVEDSQEIDELKRMLCGKKIVLMAPGKSLQENKTVIEDYRNKGFFLISINTIYKPIKPDMLFISNMRRFQSLNPGDADGIPIVLTSNILHEKDERYFVINYSDYLNENHDVMDNAGLMCLNLLERLEAGEVVLAGFDGFQTHGEKNFVNSEMDTLFDEERLIDMNTAIKKRIEQLKTRLNISFIGDSIYSR